jgi:hypothetical protein
MTSSTRVGPLLQIFFTDHWVAQRRLSLQTVASYRDTFRLLLQLVHRESGIEPAVPEIPELDAEIILSSRLLQREPVKVADRVEVASSIHDHLQRMCARG